MLCVSQHMLDHFFSENVGHCRKAEKNFWTKLLDSFSKGHTIRNLGVDPRCLSFTVSALGMGVSILAVTFADDSLGCRHNKARHGRLAIEPSSNHAIHDLRAHAQTSGPCASTQKR